MPEAGYIMVCIMLESIAVVILVVVVLGFLLSL